MRGEENENVPGSFFFDIEQRLPQDHPLRIIKALIEPVLTKMSPALDDVCSGTGHHSIPPAGQGGNPLVVASLSCEHVNRRVRVRVSLLEHHHTGTCPDDASGQTGRGLTSRSAAPALSDLGSINSPTLVY